MTISSYTLPVFVVIYAVYLNGLLVYLFFIVHLERREKRKEPCRVRNPKKRLGSVNHSNSITMAAPFRNRLATRSRSRGAPIDCSASSAVNKSFGGTGDVFPAAGTPQASTRHRTTIIYVFHTRGARVRSHVYT